MIEIWALYFSGRLERIWSHPANLSAWRRRTLRSCSIQGALLRRHNMVCTSTPSVRLQLLSSQSSPRPGGISFVNLSSPRGSHRTGSIWAVIHEDGFSLTSLDISKRPSRSRSSRCRLCCIRSRQIWGRIRTPVAGQGEHTFISTFAIWEIQVFFQQSGKSHPQHMVSEKSELPLP
jgi:hypothetical protein